MSVWLERAIYFLKSKQILNSTTICCDANTKLMKNNNKEEWFTGNQTVLNTCQQ